MSAAIVTGDEVQRALEQLRGGAEVMRRLADQRLGEFCANCDRPEPSDPCERRALILGCVQATVADIAAEVVAGAMAGELVQ